MPHTGHRQRMRKRFCNDRLEDHELLELLLYYGIPRLNTNDIAHMLIDRFGSLRGVFDADLEDLMTVDGVGESSAILIRAVSDIMARYMQSANPPRELLGSYSALSRYLTSLFIGGSEEKTFMLLFGAGHRLIACERVGTGLPTENTVSMRHMMQRAISSGATFVILAHNHPFGLAEPSAADREATEKMRNAFADVGVRLIDHFIISGDRCVPILHEECRAREDMPLLS